MSLLPMLTARRSTNAFPRNDLVELARSAQMLKFRCDLCVPSRKRNRDSRRSAHARASSPEGATESSPPLGKGAPPTKAARVGKLKREQSPGRATQANEPGKPPNLFTPP